MKLKKKLAIITGGSSGIGYAVAELFLREGAKVVITGRDQNKINIVQNKLGSNALCIKADVTQMLAMEELYRTVKSHFNQKIDILVANAGIVRPTPINETSEEIFDKILAINIKGVFLTIQKALPYLNPGASIILVSSLAAKQGIKNFSAYCASKAAVASLAKCFAAELISENIRVNSISPGVVRTPMIERLELSEDVLAQWSTSIPMKRIASVEEIATAILFLASDEARYITASDLAVDGGISGISPF